MAAKLDHTVHRSYLDCGVFQFDKDSMVTFPKDSMRQLPGHTLRTEVDRKNFTGCKYCFKTVTSLHLFIVLLLLVL